MKIEDAIKQKKKFDLPVQKAMVNIIYTYHWLMDKQSEVFKKEDITLQQYNVLRILKGRYPDAACVGDIKEVMLDKNPDLTRLCDRLVKKNLIVREFNSTNRRQVLIKITKQGLQLIKDLDPDLKKLAQNNFFLHDKEADKLSDLLDKMRG